MSTRCPAQVKSTAVTEAERKPSTGFGPGGSATAPAAGLPAVGPADERKRRARQDLEVDLRRAVVDVPDVELDPLLPRQRRPPVDLRPAGDPRPHLETAPLTRCVPVDLVAQRRAGADQAHVAADDIPQLRQLVDR